MAMRSTVLAGLMLTIASMAHASDSPDFEALSPQLRGFLVDTLVAADDRGHLPAHRGATGNATIATALDAAIDNMDAADRKWVASQVRTAAGVDDPARLPANLILSLFYDLSDFARYYEAHGHGPADDASASRDYRRLQSVFEKPEVAR